MSRIAVWRYRDQGSQPRYSTDQLSIYILWVPRRLGWGGVGLKGNIEESKGRSLQWKRPPQTEDPILEKPYTCHSASSSLARGRTCE